MAKIKAPEFKISKANVEYILDNMEHLDKVITSLKGYGKGELLKEVLMGCNGPTLEIVDKVLTELRK